MKKIILSLTTALIVSCTSAEDAETFMNQYKNMEGAQYENITRNLKTDAEKNKDKNPKNYEFSKKIKNAQYVHIELNDDERKAVTKEIENIDNYKCLYQINDKSGNQNNEERFVSPNRQYYGIEENGVVKDAIARIDFIAGTKTITSILHLTGEFTISDLMNIMGFEEDKNLNSTIKQTVTK